MPGILARMWQFGDEVLGMNARNLEFVYRLNQRRLFRRVDDKLMTKDILSAGGVPVPATLAVFRDHSDLDTIDTVVATARKKGFALKPSMGFGGRGIMIAWPDGGCLVTSEKGRRRTLDFTPDPKIVIPGDVECKRMERAKRRHGSFVS